MEGQISPAARRGLKHVPSMPPFPSSFSGVLLVRFGLGLRLGLGLDVGAGDEDGDKADLMGRDKDRDSDMDMPLVQIEDSASASEVGTGGKPKKNMCDGSLPPIDFAAADMLLASRIVPIVEGGETGEDEGADEEA